MKIFVDVFSDCEIISDSYKMVEKFDGVIVEVKAKLIVKKEGEVDIGRGNEFGGGGEEEGGEGAEEKVIDILDAYTYGETAYDKPQFMGYFKAYMKKVLDHLQKNNPDRVDKFKAGAKEFMGWIKENFDDLGFYTPSNYDTENHIIISYYQGEDVAPTFIYMMDGLKGIKMWNDLLHSIILPIPSIIFFFL